MKKSSAIALLGSFAVVLALVGCSTASKNEPAPAAKAPAAAPAAPAPAPKPDRN
jgi:hypothetical protein